MTCVSPKKDLSIDRRLSYSMITTYDIFRFPSKEDRLTAQFVYALENTDRAFLMKKFLRSCMLSVEKLEDFDLVTFEIQAQKHKSIPDVAIAYKGRDILFIESKPFQNVSSKQLLNHIESGLGEVPVLCLTGKRSKPDGVAEAQRILGRKGLAENLIKWMSWKTVYSMIKSLPNNIKDKPEIIGMLKSLEGENLLGFIGYKKQEFEGLPEFVKKYRNILNITEQLMEDIKSYLQEKNPKIRSSDYHPKNEDLCLHIFYLENWEICGDTWQEGIGSFAGIRNDFESGFFNIFVRIGLRTIEKHARNEAEMIELWDKIESNLGEIFGNNYDQFYVIDKALEFRAKYAFDEEFLFKSPAKVVHSFGQKLLSVLNLLQTSKYFEKAEYEEDEFIEELKYLVGKGKTMEETSYLTGIELKEIKKCATKGKVKFRE